MTHDLISIIVPSYNHQEYVKENLSSIVQQTYPNIELIVIDDSSTDSTWQIIQDMEATCKNNLTKVIFKTHPNKGLVGTCRELLKLCTGKYVLLMASDDFLKPEAIETLHSFLSKNPDYVLAVCDDELIDEQSQRIYWDKKRNTVPAEKATFSTFAAFLQNRRKDIDFKSNLFGEYASLLKGNYIPNGYLIRLDLLRMTDSFNPEIPMEDWYMMIQLSKLGKFKFIDQALYNYRWHSLNSSKQKNHMNIAGRKTLQYEIKRMQSLEPSIYLEKLNQFLETNAKRVYVKIGNFLEFYKLKNIAYKKFVLIIGNRKFEKKVYYKTS